MVYDSARHRVVLFGGNAAPSGAVQFNDTWEWDGTAWILASVTGPSARAAASFAFNAGRSRSVLYGGCAGSGCVWLGDTWEWTGSFWTQLSISGPPARVQASMSYDVPRHRIVLFGGWRGAALNETWELRVIGSPAITLQPLPTSVCTGWMAFFGVTASGTGLSYQWRRAGVNLGDGPTGTGSVVSGATTSALTVTGVTSADAGIYDCVITNACGSITSNSATLDVVSPTTPPAPVVSHPTCGFAVLTPQGTPAAGESWYWQDGSCGTSTANPVTGPRTVTSSGTYRIRARNNTSGCWSAVCGTAEVVVQACTTVFVRSEASPGGNGFTWATAFNDLQAALDHARATPQVTQIWVAGGLVPGSAPPQMRRYRPDRGTLDRMKSFALVSNVALFGGFAGNELQLSQRNWRLNETVLHGDLLNNDLPDPVLNRDDNTNNLIKVGNAVNAVLDGFVVKGGWASAEPVRGAGLLNEAGNPVTIRNCIFERNDAAMGAAVYSQGSPFIVDCVFRDNRNILAGGALALGGPGTPLVLNTLFNGNYSNVHGGAVGIESGSMTDFVNCTFFGNHALTGNGGAMYVAAGASVRLTNCIAWRNGVGSCLNPTPNQMAGPGAIDVSFSCVENLGGGGPGNIVANPWFVNPSGPAVFQTCGAIGVNLRLADSSRAIDSGKNNAVPAGTNTDLDGNPRFRDDLGMPNTGVGTPPLVDMGAFEYQLRSCYPDCYQDGSLNLADFGCFQTWFAIGNPRADCNGDGAVNLSDFGCFQTRFALGCQ